MGLTRNQVFSIFIAVVMVGSILGIIAYTPPDTSSQPNAPGPQQQATTVSYSAGGVQAKIEQLFPSAVLILKTSELDAGALEKKLLAIPGIAGVSNSQFVSLQGGAQENFRTELRLSSPDKISEVYSAILAIDSVSSAQLFSQALARVSGKVAFRNPDLDLEQDYSFPNNAVQAFVSSNTRKGDEVLLSIQATFAGQALSQAIAIEEKNLTAEPQIYLVNSSYKLDSFSGEYFVRATKPLSEQSILEGIKAELAEQDSNLAVKITPASSMMSVYFAEPEKIFRQDLNTFFSERGGVTSFAIDENSSRAQVQFSEGTDYNSFRPALQEDLDSLGFKVSRIEDPVVSMQGTLVPSAGKEEFLKIIAAIEKKDSVQLEVLEKASVAAGSVFVPDVNKSFTLAKGSFGAFVKTSHKEGDEVTLAILLVATEKGGISDIQAQEAEAQN